MTSFEAADETTDETLFEVTHVDTPRDDVPMRTNPKPRQERTPSLVGTVDLLAGAKAGQKRAVEEERARNAHQAHQAYQAWSWLGFVLIFGLLGGMEVGVVLLVRTVPANHVGPVSSIAAAGYQLEAAASTFMTQANVTLAQKGASLRQILGLVKTFEQVVATAYEDGATMARYCIAPVAVQFALFVLVAVFFALQRDSKEIKSRGRPFLINFFVAGILAHITSAFLTFIPCLVFTNFPRTLSLTNTDELKHTAAHLATEMLLTATATLCCCIFTLGALMQRQRIIRQLFDKTTRLNRDLRYMKLFWLHFVSAGIVSTCLIVWRIAFNVDMAHRFWALGSLLAVILGYGGYFLYLIVATKHALVVFSDFALNVRAFVWMETVTLTVVIFHLIYPDEVAYGFFAYAAVTRAAITITLLDMAWSLMVMHKLGSVLQSTIGGGKKTVGKLQASKKY